MGERKEAHLSTTAECVLAEGERPPVVFGAGLDVITSLDTSTSSKYERILLETHNTQTIIPYQFCTT